MTNAYDPGSQFRQSSSYGKRSDPFTGERKLHAGQDFKAQAGTPIPPATSGEVVYSGFNKGFGNVVIVKNDSGDYSLYAHMQDGDRAKLGQRIWQGDMIGRVGSTGARSTGDHLHYSVITKEAGERITRTNNGGSIGISLDDPANSINPAQYDNYDPAPYLDATERAAQIMLGTDASAASGGLASDRQDLGRQLGRRVVNPSRASISDVTVPAVPFVPPNEVLAPGDRASLGDRFGNWMSSDSGITPRNPNWPLPMPEPSAPLGIFSGPPMPLWAAPPPISGLPENSDAPGNGNWFTSLAKALANARKSQAPTTDARIPAAAFVPSDSPNTGGLAGRIAAAAGIDPQNPSQFAPPQLDDGLRGFYRDDATQPWLLQGLGGQR